MSNNTRVPNITRGFTLKFKQAIKAVEECAAAWTDETRSAIRDLTLAESIAARNEQAKKRAPLASVEVGGCVWEPPISERSRVFLINRWQLIREARELAANQS